MHFSVIYESKYQLAAQVSLSCVIAQKLANGHLKHVSKLFASEYTSCLQEQPDAE